MPPAAETPLSAYAVELARLDLAGKRIELLKEAAPRVSRVGVLINPLHVGEDDELRESQIAAQGLGLKLQPFPVRTATEVNAALEAMARDHVEAGPRTCLTFSSCASGMRSPSSEPSNGFLRSPDGKTSRSMAIS